MKRKINKYPIRTAVAYEYDYRGKRFDDFRPIIYSSDKPSIHKAKKELYAYLEEFGQNRRRFYRTRKYDLKQFKLREIITYQNDELGRIHEVKRKLVNKDSKWLKAYKRL